MKKTSLSVLQSTAVSWSVLFTTLTLAGCTAGQRLSFACDFIDSWQTQQADDQLLSGQVYESLETYSDAKAYNADCQSQARAMDASPPDGAPVAATEPITPAPAPMPAPTPTPTPMPTSPLPFCNAFTTGNCQPKPSQMPSD